MSPPTASPPMKRLGELLVERGWLERGDLLRALNLQRQVGGRLGTSLLEMGLVSEEELVHALGLQHNIEPVEIDALRQVPEEVRALLPAKLAVRCRSVPVSATASKVHVAVLDPRDLGCQDELAFAIGRRLVLRAASELRLGEALERYYGEACGPRMTRILDRLNRHRYLWAGGDAGPAPPPLPRPTFSQPPPPARRERPAAGRAPGAAPPPPAESSAAAPPVAAAPPRPAPQPRPTAVHLSETERAALYGGRAPAPLSYADAEARLADVGERDEAGRLVVDFLRQELDRVILFAVRRDETRGWVGDGDDLSAARIAAVAVPFGKPSIFLNLRQGSAFHLGPLPALPAHRPLVELLGGEPPEECLLLPVRIGERMVAVLYGDRGGEHLGSIDLEALRRLADAFADALERCILLKRQAQT
jgi:hypothetical protein